MSHPIIVRPDWPLDHRLGALVTTRQGGVSNGPWAEFNLGINTADDLTSIERNRQILQRLLDPGVKIQWLRQVHGNHVVEAGAADQEIPEADACYTTRTGHACAVLTADCLPIFIVDEVATEVALVHAGWRGLASGVIPATLARFRAPRERLLAWLGPAISAVHFEVGEEVRLAFEQSPGFADLPLEQAFQAGSAGKWFADLYELARMQLRSLGLVSISGGDHCTFAESEHFYSYRRDGETGRMASLIWLKD